MDSSNLQTAPDQTLTNATLPTQPREASTMEGMSQILPGEDLSGLNPTVSFDASTNLIKKGRKGRGSVRLKKSKSKFKKSGGKVRGNS